MHFSHVYRRGTRSYSRNMGNIPDHALKRAREQTPRRLVWTVSTRWLSPPRGPFRAGFVDVFPVTFHPVRAREIALPDLPASEFPLGRPTNPDKRIVERILVSYLIFGKYLTGISVYRDEFIKDFVVQDEFVRVEFGPYKIPVLGIPDSLGFDTADYVHFPRFGV